MKTRNDKKQRGSLALEQVLFIGAVVLMAAGVMTFYTNLGNYFTSVSMPDKVAIPDTSKGLASSTAP